MQNISAPRGTRDLFGEELQKNKYLEKLLKEIAHSFNCQEIKTPIFEHKEVFLHNNHPEDDESSSELFFLSGNKYVLRPEHTAAIVRAINSNKLLFQMTQPINFFYFSKTFRYERPQFGRLREFIQFGVEKINAKHICNDIEIILLVEQIFKTLKIPYVLKINCLGNESQKQMWNNELKKYFSNFEDLLSETSKKRIKINPFRIFDDKKDSKLECIKNAPKIIDFLTEEQKEKIDIFKQNLDELEIKYQWDESLVRGIDYYTGFVYEWQYKDNLTMAAGGRYDELFDKTVNQKIPSLGFAMGIERLISILDKEEFVWNFEKNNQIYIVNMTKNFDKQLINLIDKLREDKVTITTNWDKTKLNDHLNLAKKTKENYLLIYGEKEQESKQIVLKKQFSSEETRLSIENIKNAVLEIKKIINASN